MPTRPNRNNQARGVLNPLYLYLGYCGLVHRGVPDPKARDALLTEGAVEHPIRSELFSEANGAAKHASEGYVLPEHDLKNKKKHNKTKRRPTECSVSPLHRRKVVVLRVTCASQWRALEAAK